MSGRRFKLKTSKIPIINLRTDFEACLKVFRNDDFRDHIKKCPREIELHMMLWRGNPSDLMTFLIQKAILGLESYLPACLQFAYAFRKGRPPEKYLSLLKDPFAEGSTTLKAYYDQAPGMIGMEFRLVEFSREISSANMEFYRNVRNKLFHGDMVNDDVDGCLAIMEHIDKIYAWADTWFPPNSFMSGFQQLIDDIRSHEKSIGATRLSITFPIRPLSRAISESE